MVRIMAKIVEDYGNGALSVMLQHKTKQIMLETVLRKIGFEANNTLTYT